VPVLEQIRQFLKNTPFQPFEIHCSSGEVFRVEHPENAAVVGQQVVVALPDDKNAIMISPFHIVGVSGIQNVSA
jgi:hypothetical protein